MDNCTCNWGTWMGTLKDCSKRRCTLCEHYYASHGETVDHKCTRTASKQCDPIYGTISWVYKTLRNCESERSPVSWISWLDKLLGYKDKCLPEGKYFKVKR